MAQADRLITVPLGRKLPFGTVRYEYRWSNSSGGASENLLAAGITKAFEIEARTSFRKPDEIVVGTFDVAYNFIAPLPDISPGISIGVQDVLNQTEDQRQAYFALTSRTTMPTPTGNAIADVHVGLLQGRYSHAFFGTSIPIVKEARLLAEHNGYRLTAGLELRPVRDVALRVQFSSQQTMMSLQLSHRF